MCNSNYQRPFTKIILLRIICTLRAAHLSFNNFIFFLNPHTITLLGCITYYVISFHEVQLIKMGNEICSLAKKNSSVEVSRDSEWKKAHQFGLSVFALRSLLLITRSLKTENLFPTLLCRERKKRAELGSFFRKINQRMK